MPFSRGDTPHIPLINLVDYYLVYKKAFNLGECSILKRITPVKHQHTHTFAPFLSPSVRTPSRRLSRKYDISSSMKISGSVPTAPSTWPTRRSARHSVGSILVPIPGDQTQTLIPGGQIACVDIKTSTMSHRNTLAQMCDLFWRKQITHFVNLANSSNRRSENIFLTLIIIKIIIKMSIFCQNITSPWKTKVRNGNGCCRPNSN